MDERKKTGKGGGGGGGLEGEGLEGKGVTKTKKKRGRRRGGAGGKLHQTEYFRPKARVETTEATWEEAEGQRTRRPPQKPLAPVSSEL